ncbi:polyprenol reductase-like [Liolophura sinensis]|uniref:polyprenol reductase-like n=1 Tax=Liolophura sinensis TaxID=3198878 RepID=UPI0031595679
MAAREAFGVPLPGIEVFWASLSGAYFLAGLYDGVADKGTVSGRDFSGQTGLLRFAKRPVKRWFLALGVNLVLVYSALRAYVSGVPAYGWVSAAVDSVSLADAQPEDHLSVVLASGLLTIHLIQKLDQSVFVHVYSSSTQGPLDFLAPYLYAAGVSLTLFAQAPALHGTTEPWFHWSSFKWYHLLGVGLFAWVTYQDHACQPALSNTRRNRAGHIVTVDHKLPKGGWYDTVACPGYLMTVLSHVAIGVTLGPQHGSWWVCTGYVTISHVVRALERRRWYRLKYEDFPRSRKAIFPKLL